MGLRVKEERERRRLSQEQLAEKAGLSRRLMQYVESGRSVSLASLVKLSIALGIDIRRFFDVPSEGTSRRDGRPFGQSKKV